MKLADPGVMVDEDVSFGLGISDCAAIMGHGFIALVGIWDSFETSNDLPHTWAIII